MAGPEVRSGWNVMETAVETGSGEKLHAQPQGDTQHPPALPGVTASPLRPGFIIGQGQGS